MLLLIVSLAVLVPIGTYIWIGFFKKESKANSLAEYYLANQEISADDYANTSVGYGLQMASLFLFAEWGMRYGLGALWVPVFWAGGFWLLLRVLPKFDSFHSSKLTLHGYLRVRFGNSVALQRLAAVLTILGLGGTMLAEVDYTVGVFGPLHLPPGSLFAAFLLFGTGYIVINGFKAEVITERYQVPVAYSCLVGTLLFLLPAVWENSTIESFRSIVVLLLLALGFVAFGKLLTVSTWTEIFGTFHFRMFVVATLVVIVELFVLKAHAPSGAVAILTSPISSQIEAQGIVQLVSLLAANFLWMIVDISTWQRVAAVGSATPGVFPIEALRKGTRRVVFESPATWVLGVSLGWIMVAVLPKGSNPSNGIATLMDLMSSGGAFSGSTPLLPPELMRYVVYPAFAAACVAVMLTTVNALVSTISFTLYCDVLAGGMVASNQATDEEKKRLKKAQIVTAVSIILGALAFPLAKMVFGNSLQTVLYTAYAAQLSLFVVAVLALWNVNCRRRSAIVSLIAGLAMSLACGVLSGLNPDNFDLGVMPPLFGLVGAFAGYVITYRFEKPASAEAGRLGS
jgi:hypothetical protein